MKPEEKTLEFTNLSLLSMLAMIPKEGFGSSSGLRPRAGMREDSLYVKGPAQVQGLHLCSPAQLQIPHTAPERGLAGQTVLLDVGC